MNKCHPISRSLISLSASGIASKPLSVYVGHTLVINFDNLQASCYTKLIILLNKSHVSLLCVYLNRYNVYLRQQLSIM